MKNANAYVEISGEINANCIKRRSSRVALYLYVKIVYLQNYLSYTCTRSTVYIRNTF